MTCALVAGWLLFQLSQDAAGATELDARVAALVQDGSDDSVQALSELCREGRREFDVAARGIVRIAERALVEGDKQRARQLANQIWLSSSPNDARQAAWRVLFFTDAKPRQLAAGYQVHIEAPGSRDHARFEHWLRSELVNNHEWIRDFEVRYEPTLISPGRAGELARLTFVLSQQSYVDEFLKLLAGTHSTYSTEGWSVIRRLPIRQSTD